MTSEAKYVILAPAAANGADPDRGEFLLLGEADDMDAAMLVRRKQALNGFECVLIESTETKNRYWFAETEEAMRAAVEEAERAEEAEMPEDDGYNSDDDYYLPGRWDTF